MDASRIKTRLDQGWVKESYEDLEQVFASAQKHLAAKTAISIAYHGNIVDLLEYVVSHGQIKGLRCYYRDKAQTFYLPMLQRI